MCPLFRSRRAMLTVAAALTIVLASTASAAGLPVQARANQLPAASQRAHAGLGSGAIVVDWNKALVKILGTPGVQPATIHPTRSLAILHTAIYNAVVSITHSNAPYLYAINTAPGARPDAAAAQAGHDVLVTLYPTWQATLDQQLNTELVAIPDGPAKQQGIAVGHLAATLSIGQRTGDGSTATPPPLPASTQPGDFRPIPPAFTPAVFTHWSAVTPFVLQTASQFRSAAPPVLDSTAYAQSMNDVKSLGQDTSTTRTADQTVAAKFWAGPIWITWNEIAETSALAHHSNLVSTARMFALLDLSFADTTIAFYDSKYYYHVWRPITAIREAGTTNSAVTADPTWTPLVAAATDPSYPGAHSAISSAGATVLTSVFGKHTHISVTSDVLPGVVRTFSSYNAVATEAGMSRIYAGLHTPADHAAGLKLGQSVAGFILGQAKSPRFGLRTQ